MRIILFLLFLIMCGCKTLVKNETISSMEKHCGNINGMGYCGYSDPNPTTTLIYFHGLLDTKKSLELSIFDQRDLKELIQQMKPTAVVVVSYGINWMIKANEVDGRITALKVKTNIEQILEKYSLPKEIYAIGHSQGGFNLAVMAATYPEMFKKIVLVSPVLFPKGVNPLTQKGICLPCSLVKDNFTVREWAMSNPRALMAATDKYPKAMFSYCDKDIFKLADGVLDYYSQAREKNFDIILVNEGNSCKHTTFPLSEVNSFFKVF